VSTIASKAKESAAPRAPKALETLIAQQDANKPKHRFIASAGRGRVVMTAGASK